MQGLLVVDESKVSRLADETSRLARLYTGLTLLRYKEPEGAERRPDHGSCHIGCPDEGCGIGQGHKQRSCNPVSTSCPMSGNVGQDERTLRSTEVLEVNMYLNILIYCINMVSLNVFRKISIQTVTYGRIF